MTKALVGLTMIIGGLRSSHVVEVRERPLYGVCGGIGKRASLWMRWSNPCGFESHLIPKFGAVAQLVERWPEEPGRRWFDSTRLHKPDFGKGRPARFLSCRLNRKEVEQIRRRFVKRTGTIA